MIDYLNTIDEKLIKPLSDAANLEENDYYLFKQKIINAIFADLTVFIEKEFMQLANFKKCIDEIEGKNTEEAFEIINKYISESPNVKIQVEKYLNGRVLSMAKEMVDIFMENATEEQKSEFIKSISSQKLD